MGSLSVAVVGLTGTTDNGTLLSPPKGYKWFIRQVMSYVSGPSGASGTLSLLFIPGGALDESALNFIQTLPILQNQPGTTVTTQKEFFSPMTSGPPANSPAGQPFVLTANDQLKLVVSLGSRTGSIYILIDEVLDLD